MIPAMARCTPPAARTNHVGGPSHRSAAVIRRASMSPFDKPRRPPLVLVANDQEWSARSLESILGPNGYAVLRAYTGRQALDLAKTTQPDIVILDSKMSDMTGIELCALLREDP